MSTMNQQNVDEILRRLMFAKKFDTYQQVADFLGEDNKTVSAWKARNSRVAVQKISAKCSDMDLKWILTGESGLPATQLSNGNGFIQGRTIEAEEIHIDFHQERTCESHEQYRDPVLTAFIKDWEKLSEIGRLRAWTWIKEELEREKEGGT